MSGAAFAKHHALVNSTIGSTIKFLFVLCVFVNCLSNQGVDLAFQATRVPSWPNHSNPSVEFRSRGPGEQSMPEFMFLQRNDIALPRRFD